MRRHVVIRPLRFGQGLGRALALAAAVLACAACPSKLAMTPQTFTLDPPPPRAVPAPGATRVLALRPAEVAPAYAGISLIYRTGDHEVDRDPYASFAAPPGLLVTSAIRVYLRDADFVRDVVGPGEGVPVDARIEPALMELFGDFTKTDAPAAVMVIHFRVLTPAIPDREILLKTYTVRRPISRRTAEAVVAAWNEDLGEIMAEFIGDLKAVVPAPAPAN
jgi:cholesterol transport system auxiliary component